MAAVLPLPSQERAARGVAFQKRSGPPRSSCHHLSRRGLRLLCRLNLRLQVFHGDPKGRAQPDPERGAVRIPQWWPKAISLLRFGDVHFGRQRAGPCQTSRSIKCKRKKQVWIPCEIQACLPSYMWVEPAASKPMPCRERGLHGNRNGPRPMLDSRRLRPGRQKTVLHQRGVRGQL